MLKKTKREQKKKIKEQTKEIKKMVKDNLHHHVPASERSRLLLIEAYASCIGKQKTLPTLLQLEKMTGLSTPTIMKHQQSIVSESKTEFQERLAPYKELFIANLINQSMGERKCARSAKLLAQIMDLLSVDTTINLNKQTVTSFKIVSNENENEKKIEGVG